MHGDDSCSKRCIPGGFRRYAFDAADGHRVAGDCARLCLGDVGDVGHLSRLAERAGGFVRCGVECVAREHCADGVGFLFAVMVLV